jgi:hypothetical protein
MKTAALLIGFVDQQFDGWPDGRQETEVMQRERIGVRLDNKLPASERQNLFAQGRRLDPFEADVLAGFEGK